jgi:hypothetical protein
MKETFSKFYPNLNNTTAIVIYNYRSNASRAQAKRPWFTSKEDLDKIKILKSIKTKTTYL